MASCHEAALIRFEKDAHAYLFPVGTGCDIKNVIDELVEENRKNKEKFRIIAARKEDCDLLESLFPDKFKYHLTRDYAEYVYNTEDLAELVGKKFHSKRNFISRFTAEHPDYEFCEITRENLAQVCEMNNLWYEENLTSDNDGLAEERIAASVAL
ncbi:MAG: phosphatidylglycerol lysyltransferase domain-containing protein, partial [Oscillospiraceae bacterium]